SLLGCNQGSKPPDAPAEKPHVEADLARTTLSERAATSLDVHSEPLRPTSVRQYLPLPGWLAVKQGNEVTPTAPVAGYVRAPTSSGCSARMETAGPHVRIPFPSSRRRPARPSRSPSRPGSTSRPVLCSSVLRTCRSCGCACPCPRPTCRASPSTSPLCSCPSR